MRKDDTYVELLQGSAPGAVRRRADGRAEAHEMLSAAQEAEASLAIASEIDRGSGRSPAESGSGQGDRICTRDPPHLEDCSARWSKEPARRAILWVERRSWQVLLTHR